MLKTSESGTILVLREDNGKEKVIKYVVCKIKNRKIL